MCYTSKQVNVTGPSGYLSSLITAESGFGSESCPWVIRVDSGQRINITLLDFTLAAPKKNGYNEVRDFFFFLFFCKKKRERILNDACPVLKLRMPLFWISAGWYFTKGIPNV